MTTLTEQAATELLTDMLDLADGFVDRRQPGEFTTDEFAEAAKVDKARAYAILCRRLEGGAVTMRKVMARCLWKKIKVEE